MSTATDHIIELTEGGLAFCTRCRGGEIELEESCVDRLVRENAELRQKISDMEEEQFNRMVERNLRDSE